MNARDLSFGVAAAVLVVGLLAVFTPVVDAADLGGDQLRAVVGFGTTVAGGVLVTRWFRSEPTAHEPRERERLAPLATAGSDFDQLLALAGGGTDETTRFYRSRARDHLTAVAVAVLTTHRGCSPEEAREQLRTGAWTDDPVAARFFVAGSEYVDDVRGFVATATGSGHPTSRRARRAVAELRRIAAGEGED